VPINVGDTTSIDARLFTNCASQRYPLPAKDGAKTNALECSIEADLREVIAGLASVLVMDRQGMTPRHPSRPSIHAKLFAPRRAAQRQDDLSGA